MITLKTFSEEIAKINKMPILISVITRLTPKGNKDHDVILKEKILIGAITKINKLEALGTIDSLDTNFSASEKACNKP